MPKLNWKFILHNLRDAQEEIDCIIRDAEAGALDEIGFETKMEHAYHHLNFAWNILKIPTERASECIPEDFNAWSKFPSDLDEFKL